MKVKEFLIRLKDAFMSILHGIGWFMSRVILTIFYATMFFAYWIFITIFRKDLLDLKLNVASAWHVRPPDDDSIDRARRLS